MIERVLVIAILVLLILVLLAALGVIHLPVN